jgi:hypothetical protein
MECPKKKEGRPRRKGENPDLPRGRMQDYYAPSR